MPKRRAPDSPSDSLTTASCLALNGLGAVWPSLKLIGERGLLLLRFRPRTVLPLVRNPERALESAPLPVLASRHQCLSRINELWNGWRRHSMTRARRRLGGADERIIEKSSSCSTATRSGRLVATRRRLACRLAGCAPRKKVNDLSRTRTCNRVSYQPLRRCVAIGRRCRACQSDAPTTIEFGLLKHGQREPRTGPRRPVVVNFAYRCKISHCKC